MTGSVFGGIHNFFHSTLWSAIQAIGELFLVVLWLATVYWVHKDAKRRIESRALVWLVTLLGPCRRSSGRSSTCSSARRSTSRTSASASSRSGRSRAGSARGSARSAGAEVEADFLVCPVCTTKLRQSCANLQAPARARLAGLPVLRDAGSLPSRSGGLSRPPSTLAQRAGQRKLSRRMAVERTLILAKPDAVARNLAGEILARFERRGLELRAARLVSASRELGETHYAEHREKPFFGELVDFITSGPTLAFVLEGEGAIATARKTIGATNPADADPGSLRGEFALAMPNNLVHGSDSPESAEREIGLWFPDGLV